MFSTQLNLTDRFLLDEVFDDPETSSERIHRIHKQLCKVRINSQVGVRYMQAWKEKIYDKKEHRAETFFKKHCFSGFTHDFYINRPGLRAVKVDQIYFLSAAADDFSINDRKHTMISHQHTF